MKFMLGYLKEFRGRMTVGLFIKIIGTLVELFIPLILTFILREVVPSQSVGKILVWGGVMIACAAAACVLNIVANRMAAHVSRDVSENVRRDLFAKILSLSASQVDRFTVPSLESRITTDTYNIHSFVGVMQRMGVRAPILLFGGIVLTLAMDSALALVMIALLPFVLLAIFLISRNGVPLYTRVQKSTDAMIRVVREDVQGIRVIKALSKNRYENERYDGVNKQLSGDEKYAGTVMGLSNPIMTFLMNMGITAVVALAAVRVSKSTSDAETVIAFIQYFTLISNAMLALSRIFVMFTKCAASTKRIAEVLLTEGEMAVINDGREMDRSSAHIEFDNVSFSYNGKHNHLENVSFSLQKGESLGIIGATGSGKSTIVKLLLRLYDTSSGSVKIYGKDIRTIDNFTLRSMLGVALQNDFLYAETIEENIKFGREISHEDVVRAAKIAQAHDFISSFPEGYERVLSQKGTNISGGQKQRILIARAIAASPEILILDDSSSALDYKTDASLRLALAESLGGTTVITVAQRVSSVKNCDLIMVIENGSPIGLGTHEELLSSCPEYKEISDSQMGGAFVE